MYKTEEQAEEYIQALLPRVSAVDGVDVAICVPFTDLRAMVDSARGSRVEVYAQNMHHEPEGAFTGEISAPMLSELDVRGVVLGHSERRELFGETDKALALKVPAALAAGLAPILCVGETEAGARQRRHRPQAAPADQGGPRGRAERATGGGGDRLRADLGDRHRAASRRRSRRRRRSRSSARSWPTATSRRPSSVRILYGGSVKPENAAELLALPDVDGALVGGASLEAESFAAIVAAAGAMTLPPGPASLPARCACLIVLDGWGLAEPGPGNAVSLARHAGVRRAVGRLPAHDADRLRAARWACRKGRWATARSAT